MQVRFAKLTLQRFDIVRDGRSIGNFGQRNRLRLAGLIRKREDRFRHHLAHRHCHRRRLRQRCKPLVEFPLRTRPFGNRAPKRPSPRVRLRAADSKTQASCTARAKPAHPDPALLILRAPKAPERCNRMVASFLLKESARDCSANSRDRFCALPRRRAPIAFSTEPNRRIRSFAPFSPIPGAPGILSIASPFNASRSATWCGSTPMNS